MSGQHEAGPAVAVEEPRRGAGDVTPEAATRRGDFTVAQDCLGGCCVLYSGIKHGNINIPYL